MIMPVSNHQFNRIKVRYLIAIYFIISLFLKSIIYWSGHWQTFQESRTFIGIFNVVASIAICTWAIQKCFRSQIALNKIIGKIPHKLPWARILGSSVATILFSVGSYMIVTSLWNLLLFKLLSQTPHDHYRAEDIGYPQYQIQVIEDRIWTFIEWLVLAPIVEEFLFRAIVINRWTEKWNVSKAIIISALLFGCVHWNLNFVGITMLGLILGILYVKYQGIWVPACFHIIYNLLAFIYSLYPPFYWNLPFIYSRYENTLWFDMFQGLAMISVALISLRKFIKRNLLTLQKT